MSAFSSRRTWEDAASPSAVRLAHAYERAWRDSARLRRRPELGRFLAGTGGGEEPGLVADAGARLALLRTDMALRWESGEKVGAQWYIDRHADLSEETIVALAYEEFCLREENGEALDAAEFRGRFPAVAPALSRVLEIHQLVGAAPASTAMFLEDEGHPAEKRAAAFPEAGQLIGGFELVRELGRGTFARVFLARERPLAGRPVALKVTRRGSCEPQTLARLQHTHIVPVHSHQIDAATGLHLLCMPYFGGTTLGGLLSGLRAGGRRTVAALIAALERLEPSDEQPGAPASTSAPTSAVAPASGPGRALARVAPGLVAARTFDQALAWLGARLAEALAHAHDRGVLHRDIKPSNVLIAADGMPMLLDFNLAGEPDQDDEAALGGTVDYMAPEHLDALARGAGTVDGRSDIYGLGVVLYEAATGRRPFEALQREGSAAEVLARAAADRRRAAPRPRAIERGVSPALDAIVARCLQPEPEDRYASAADLAADLQAVCDDRPLPHAREPWPSRFRGLLRRRRRRFAMAAAAVAALSIGLVAGLERAIDRSDTAQLWRAELEKGFDLFKEGQYEKAARQLDATLDLINHFDKQDVRRFPTHWRSLPHTVATFSRKLKDLRFGPDLEEIRQRARDKLKLAERYARARADAQALYRAGDSLRFRLLLEGTGELSDASRAIQEALKPFYVLDSPNWTELDHILQPLGPEQADRLRREVNELLFFWVAAIDGSLTASAQAPLGAERLRREAETIERGTAICDRALAFVRPPGPWHVLRSWLARPRAERLAPASRAPAGERFEKEPRDVGEEASPIAAFQWALLHLRSNRLSRAAHWMRRAVRLEQNNYWYHYFLAYIEDQAGTRDPALAALRDDALNHYGIAVALRPEGPWVRFSRARLYRSKGYWSQAIVDMEMAAQTLGEGPDARQVHLELGYLHQELGDFQRARREYGEVLRASAVDGLARAARLNRANIDVESGDVERARLEYDRLLALDFGDVAARHSRALLELRLGRFERAEADLTTLIEMGPSARHGAEARAARAEARLLAGRVREALDDAEHAQREAPCPAYERLRQRLLLANQRHDAIALDRPEAVARLPVGGRRLREDLRAAAAGLARRALAHDESAYRALLSRAVVLAALGEHKAAVADAGGALALAPFSAHARLVRARVCFFGGDLDTARRDIDRGLALRADEPGLIELRGEWFQAGGRHREALADFNRAIALGARGAVRLHRAKALAALGEHNKAVAECSLALREDPESPRAFLGRARSQIALRHWDLAFADLEQAASWANSDPWTEAAVAAAYLRCLPTWPDRFPRFLTIAWRAFLDLGQAIDGLPGRLTNGVDAPL